MTLVNRLFLRKVKTWHTAIAFGSSKTLNPTPQNILQSRVYQGYASQQQTSSVFRVPIPICTGKSTQSFGIPFVLAGLFGVGVADVAYADSNEVSTNSSISSESPPSYEDLEETARKERRRLEDLIRSKGMQYGSYPRFNVAVKGQKIAIKFQVPSNCEIPRLIANLASKLNDDKPMEVRSWDSTVAWQLALSRPPGQMKVGEDNVHVGEAVTYDRDLCVLIFRSLISPDRPEIEFLKRGSFSPAELDAFVSILQLAGEKLVQSKSTERRNSTGAPSTSKSVTSLEAMGVRVFGLDEPHFGQSNDEISWDTIAGYDQQKR